MTRRQFFVALVVLFVGGVIGGAFNTWLMPGGPAWAQGSAATVKEVRAGRFVLVDVKGRERAKLGFDTVLGDAEFCLMDTTGQERAAMALVSGAPSLWFNDNRGESQLLLENWDNTPQLWIVDRAGKPRILLGIGEKNEPMSMCTDAGGRIQWHAP